jgi:membrane protease YdiL (CAAX protease family)
MRVEEDNQEKKSDNKADFKKNTVRYFVQCCLAVLWTLVLTSFAYYQLVWDIFRANKVGFERTLRDIHSNPQIIIVGISLTLMLILDVLINKVATTNSRTVRLSFIVLWVLTFVMCFLLKLFGLSISIENDIAEWMKLWYLFVPFILLIIMCKASSFAEHIRESKDIGQ